MFIGIGWMETYLHIMYICIASFDPTPVWWQNAAINSLTQPHID